MIINIQNVRRHVKNAVSIRGKRIYYNCTNELSKQATFEESEME